MVWSCSVDLQIFFMKSYRVLSVVLKQDVNRVIVYVTILQPVQQLRARNIRYISNFARISCRLKMKRKLLSFKLQILNLVVKTQFRRESSSIKSEFVRIEDIFVLCFIQNAQTSLIYTEHCH